MLQFVCEIDDPPKVKQILGNLTEAKKLRIQGDSLDGFAEYELACIEWDNADPSTLVLGIKCHLPDEVSKIPQWLRGWVRRAWRLRVQRPIVELEVNPQDQEPNVAEQRLKEITDWLFRRR